MRTLLYIAASLIAIAAIYSSSANATILKKSNVKQMIDDAEVIFGGEVTSASVDVDAEGMTWTLYTFSQIDVIAGDYESESISLRCIGGELDGVVTEVHGTPHFEVGDRALVFYDDDLDTCQVSGWMQGAFTVSEQGGRSMVFNHAGRPVVGLTQDDFVLGKRPDWWTGHGRGAASVVQRPSAAGDGTAADRGGVAGGAGEPQGSVAEASSAEAAPASLTTVKDELRAMSAARGKRWQRPSQPTRITGPAGVLRGQGSAAQQQGR